MRTTALAFTFALAVAPLLAPSPADARTQPPSPETADQSLSPYFVVKGAKDGVDTMPLKATRADISVSGTIAHVKVTQTYENTGDDVLEAIYVFPGSTRAAVFGMRMRVGDRTIVAEIQKKEQARKMYEAAKAEGKSASLLEQERPNVFTMNVANILPGDIIEVEMDYSELLVPTEGVYEVVYPAVVGPRYTGESDSGEAWTATPHTTEGVAPSYVWDVTARVDAGMPIARVTSTSHRITTDLEDDGRVADVSVSDGDTAGTKDFVLKYKLAGSAIQSGMLLFEGEGEDDENFFLAMVQPPERVADRAMPKREYIFILDVSGSMRGYPLDTAKKVMRDLLDGVAGDDLFNILYFSGDSRILSDKSLPATQENLDAAEGKLNAMRGGGGTRILRALERALDLPTPDDYARTFVVVTDGYVSVEPQVFELIRESLGEANLFAFGIGNSVNRHIIDGMARVGMGEPFFVMHADDAAEKASAFTDYIAAPALTNVEVGFSGFDAYDVEPKSSPDLFASRPVVVFGKYRGAARGTVEVSGLTGEGPWETSMRVSDYRPSPKNTALRYLWARHRIAALSDLNRLRHDDARVAEVTELGLTYNLMTAYTSFVAIDERVRNQGGDSTTIQQPLPLPSRVEDSAVGGMAMGGLGVRGAGRGGGGASGYGRGVAGQPTRRKSAADTPAKPSPDPASTDLDDSLEADAEPTPEEAEETTTRHATELRIVGTSLKGNADRAARSAMERPLRAALSDTAIAPGVRLRLLINVDADGSFAGVSIVSSKGASSDAVAKLSRALNERLARVSFADVFAGEAGRFMADIITN